MSYRNRHMQYRKSIYRKRRIRAAVISAIVAIVLGFSLFMIVGTALHSRSQQSETLQPHDTENSTLKQQLPSASVVGAYPLPLLQDGSAFSDRLKAINPEANAVCINLNSADGTLLYRSDIANKLSNVTVHSDATSLSASLTSIERNGFHASALLYVTAFDNDNDLLTDVELATWGAISCEALRQGAGDILLVSKSMDADDVEKICALADNIHSTVEDAIIGLTITDNILSEDNSATLIDTLSKHFNFLALDTTSYKTDDDPVEFIEGKISSFQLELIYYKMRVLLPNPTDAEAQQKYIDVTAKYNIQNWQIVP